METKVCRDCKEEKQVTRFQLQKGTRLARCKGCPAPRNNPLRKSDEHKKAVRDYHGRAHKLRKYGLTPEQYDEVLRGQNGVCKICNKPQGSRLLCVDHDHSCCPTPNSCCGGCVRGLLCIRCNAGLGQFRDDPELLQAAISYLADGKQMVDKQ